MIIIKYSNFMLAQAIAIFVHIKQLKFAINYTICSFEWEIDDLHN